MAKSNKATVVYSVDDQTPYTSMANYFSENNVTEDKRQELNASLSRAYGKRGWGHPPETKWAILLEMGKKNKMDVSVMPEKIAFFEFNKRIVARQILSS